MKPKILIFYIFAFALFIVDIGCTYTTFAVKGVPIACEMNTIFRKWVIEDGWIISIGKFTVLKAFLFSVCGWFIFRTRNQILTFAIAQCSISNHLVAISSHPTLWWMKNLGMRSALLCAIGALSTLITLFGIRYLRLQETQTCGARLDSPRTGSLDDPAAPNRQVR